MFLKKSRGENLEKTQNIYTPIRSIKTGMYAKCIGRVSKSRKVRENASYANSSGSFVPEVKGLFMAFEKLLKLEKGEYLFITSRDRSHWEAVQ